MHKLTSWIALGLAALALAACQPVDRTYDPAEDPLVNPPQMLEPFPDDPAAVATGQTLYRHSPGSPNTLNPLFYSTTYDSYGQGPLFEGLTSFDADFEWMVNPDMVESYEASEDQREWTFVLQEGLKWHDGHPLTAEDFVFSWQAVLDEQVPALTFRDRARQIESMEAIDARTLRIVMKESLPINKWEVSGTPLVPKHIFGNPEERAKDPTMRQSEYYTRYARQQVIGNGPYKLVEWIPEDRLVYERWEDYPGEKPYWKRIVLKIQPDRNTSLQLFNQGQLDELEVTSQQFAFETNDSRFAQIGNKALSSSWTYIHITWNQKNPSVPFFQDLKVRHALAHAFNMPHVLRTVGYGLNTQCLGIFHPDSWMFNEEIEPIEYDPARAAQLLDEAGWLRDETDGWRYKVIDGQRVRFAFELLFAQGQPERANAAAVFQQDLRRLGIEMSLRTMEVAALFSRTEARDFQAYLAGWGTGVYPDTSDNIWKSEMHKEGRNYGGYSNPRVDELFELVVREFDEQKRAEYFGEIQKLIYEDQPSLFIWNQAATFVLNNKIRGVNFSPRGIHGHYPGYSKWWVPAEMSLH